jgi:hypothetical protein
MTGFSPPPRIGPTQPQPPTPSFEPWLARVRAIRMAAAGAGMLVAASGSWAQGLTWVDAVLRGLAAALVLFFAGWGGGLWICSELYLAGNRRQREQWIAREKERQETLQRMYSERLAMLTGDPNAAASVQAGVAPVLNNVTPLTPQMQQTDMRTESMPRAA